MGIRGPQPTLKLRSNPLEDLNPPDWLRVEARAYWERHASQLAENHLLTRETAESFALHCDLWGRLCDMRGEPTSRSYLDLHKAFSTSSKHFRLIPNEKPEMKEDRFADFIEVEIE